MGSIFDKIWKEADLAKKRKEEEDRLNNRPPPKQPPPSMTLPHRSTKNKPMLTPSEADNLTYLERIRTKAHRKQVILWALQSGRSPEALARKMLVEHPIAIENLNRAYVETVPKLSQVEIDHLTSYERRLYDWYLNKDWIMINLPRELREQLEALLIKQKNIDQERSKIFQAREEIQKDPIPKPTIPNKGLVSTKSVSVKPTQLTYESPTAKQTQLNKEKQNRAKYKARKEAKAARIHQEQQEAWEKIKLYQALIQGFPIDKPYKSVWADDVTKAKIIESHEMNVRPSIISDSLLIEENAVKAIIAQYEKELIAEKETIFYKVMHSKVVIPPPVLSPEQLAKQQQVEEDVHKNFLKYYLGNQKAMVDTLFPLWEHNAKLKTEISHPLFSTIQLKELVWKNVERTKWIENKNRDPNAYLPAKEDTAPEEKVPSVFALYKHTTLDEFRKELNKVSEYQLRKILIRTIGLSSYDAKGYSFEKDQVAWGKYTTISLIIVMTIIRIFPIDIFLEKKDEALILNLFRKYRIKEQRANRIEQVIQATSKAEELTPLFLESAKLTKQLALLNNQINIVFERHRTAMPGYVHGTSYQTWFMHLPLRKKKEEIKPASTIVTLSMAEKLLKQLDTLIANPKTSNSVKDQALRYSLKISQSGLGKMEVEITDFLKQHKL